ncbi:hypothetical protein [Alkalihalobacillus sp. 1P02AB]|uniref:hypothetical protein n=1 Tax=Alkalihalobacillus sp. 1P02AB TaxID=3132260 RepID=UPI0039A52CB6
MVIMNNLSSITPQDIEEINSLLTKTFENDELTINQFLDGFKRENKLLTLKAAQNGQISGVITSWKNKVHPHSVYISYVIDLEWQHNFSVALELFTKLNNLLNSPSMYQITLPEKWRELISICERLGFKEYRKTYISVLNLPSKMNQISNISIVRESIKLVNLSEIKEDKKKRNELISLVIDTYANTHKDNPLGIFDNNFWEKKIFAKDTIYEGSFIAIERNRIIGFALLHYSDNPNRYEFGWRGTVERVEISFIQYLTYKQIIYSNQMGIMELEGEIDTTDPYSLSMFEQFCMYKEQSFVTLQKIVK